MKHILELAQSSPTHTILVGESNKELQGQIIDSLLKSNTNLFKHVIWTPC